MLNFDRKVLTFFKLHMCVYLYSKFQVSIIILANFRQGYSYFIPLPLHFRKNPKSHIRVKRKQHSGYEKKVIINFTMSPWRRNYVTVNNTFIIYHKDELWPFRPLNTQMFRFLKNWLFNKQNSFFWDSKPSK